MISDFARERFRITITDVALYFLLDSSSLSILVPIEIDNARLTIVYPTMTNVVRIIDRTNVCFFRWSRTLSDDYYLNILDIID